MPVATVNVVVKEGHVARQINRGRRDGWSRDFAGILAHIKCIEVFPDGVKVNDLAVLHDHMFVGVFEPNHRGRIRVEGGVEEPIGYDVWVRGGTGIRPDRKSTRLNSSH